jgi:hypothetical protein
LANLILSIQVAAIDHNTTIVTVSLRSSLASREIMPAVRDDIETFKGDEYDIVRFINDVQEWIDEHADLFGCDDDATFIEMFADCCQKRQHRDWIHKWCGDAVLGGYFSYKIFVGSFRAEFSFLRPEQCALYWSWLQKLQQMDDFDKLDDYCS